MEPEHLGDGAYVSVDVQRGCYVITANHHDPGQATDRVYIGLREMSKLVDFVKRAEGSDA